MQKNFNRQKLLIMSKQFDLEYQYQLYLKRVALKESDMGSIQKTVMKNAFMGACGQMLILLQEDVGTIENEDEAIEVLQHMKSQVGTYFLKEKGEQN